MGLEMRGVLHWSGLALLAAVSAFLIWFGLVYANVMGLLWFHAAAIPESVMDEIRPLYFALMRLIGGASIALGALGLYVIAGPVRKRSRLATIAIFVAYAIIFGVAGLHGGKTRRGYRRADVVADHGRFSRRDGAWRGSGLRRASTRSGMTDYSPS